MFGTNLLIGIAIGFGQGGPSAGRVPEFVPHELLVKFAADATAGQRAAALSRASAQAQERISTRAMRDHGYGEVVRVTTGRPVLAAIEEIERMPGVEFAEPNWIYRHAATSNDTHYLNGNTWGLYGDATTPANPYGSQAGEAWAAGNVGSDSVVVGIIDEGVMHSHVDLSANIWVNPYDPVDGVDNDGNGYVDDVRGWDFASNDNSTFDGSVDDHGTHVAGTIGAKGGNGTGVAGVSWNVRMISAKFLGRNGGTTANAIKAFDYLTDLKKRHGINLVASNNSWGGGGFSQALQDAIERHNQADILAICAAGNGGSDGVGDNNDAVASYPSNYPNANIVAVASITNTGARSSFSNYGATKVDLGAPGSSIASTIPSKSGGSSYAYMSGTSMATPHVTGAAALYAASHPGSTAAAIKNAILGSTVPTASLAGKCVTGGRLNVSGF
ncbi:MAG TPA: S8 family peptidase [Fimbriimonas sp.]